MSVLAAANRLARERAAWRKDPIPGFIVFPMKHSDGSLNLFCWSCAIPGRENTLYQGKALRMKLLFSEEYPIRPPVCLFEPPIFHLNVFPSGVLCHPRLTGSQYSPEMSISHILNVVVAALEDPDETNVASQYAAQLWHTDKTFYFRKVMEDLAKYPSRTETAKSVVGERLACPPDGRPFPFVNIPRVDRPDECMMTRRPCRLDYGEESVRVPKQEVEE